MEQELEVERKLRQSAQAAKQQDQRRRYGSLSLTKTLFLQPSDVQEYDTQKSLRLPKV